MKAVAVCLGVAFHLCMGVQVAPKRKLGGCDEYFERVGDQNTGVFWRGPGEMNYCLSDEGSFTFMVQGVCTEEAITCKVRKPSKISSMNQAKVIPSKGLFSLERRMSLSFQARKLHTTYDIPRNIANLVLMIKFKDHDENVLPPVKDYEQLFNSLSPADGKIIVTNSVKQYFLKQSLGKCEISSFLSGWIEVNFTEAEAAGPCSRPGGEDCCNSMCEKAKLRAAIREAIVTLERQLGKEEFKRFDANNDGAVDMMTVLHSSYGAEAIGGDKIWSHRDFVLTDCWDENPDSCPPFVSPLTGMEFSNHNINPGLWYNGENSLPTISHIGVIVHEMSHFLNLPDLYDADFSSRGIGLYGLMGNLWGFDGSQNYPPSLSAPSKLNLGWVKAEEIFDARVEGCRKVSLPDVHVQGKVAKITFSDTEYWVIENRQAKDTDSFMQGGILIWQVDEDMRYVAENMLELDPFNPSSWYRQHPMVRLIQPDDKFDLEFSTSRTDPGDWFPFANRTVFGDNLLPLPNINKYSRLGRRSGIQLSNFTSSGPTMTFTLTYTNPYTPTRIILAMDRTYRKNSADVVSQGIDFFQALAIQFDELVLDNVMVGMLDMVDRRYQWNLDLDLHETFEIFDALADSRTSHATGETFLAPLLTDYADLVSMPGAKSWIILVTDGDTKESYRLIRKGKADMRTRLGKSAPGIICFRVRVSRSTRSLRSLCDRIYSANSRRTNINTIAQTIQTLVHPLKK